MPDERLVGDVQGAAQRIKSLRSSNAKVGTIGYCSGGRQSFLAACSLPLDAAVACYPGMVVKPPPAQYGLKIGPILHLAQDLHCPLLGLFGEEDQNPSPEDVDVMDKELARLGKTYELHSYPGAGHAFFSVDRPAYRPEAAVDGWHRVDAFFGRYLAS